MIGFVAGFVAGAIGAFVAAALIAWWSERELVAYVDEDSER